MYDYFVFQSVFFMIFSFSSPLFSSLVSFSSFLFLFLFLLSCLSSYMSLFFSFPSPLSSLSPSPLFLFLFLFLSFVSSFLSLSSFSVFFLRVLVVCVSSCMFVCVVWCGVVCAVWSGTLKTPCVDSKTLSVCRFKTSPCMPATRPHAFQHVGVLPAYTGTF